MLAANASKVHSYFATSVAQSLFNNFLPADAVINLRGNISDELLEAIRVAGFKQPLCVPKGVYGWVKGMSDVIQAVIKEVRCAAGADSAQGEWRSALQPHHLKPTHMRLSPTLRSLCAVSVLPFSPVQWRHTAQEERKALQDPGHYINCERSKTVRVVCPLPLSSIPSFHLSRPIVFAEHSSSIYSPSIQ